MTDQIYHMPLRKKQLEDVQYALACVFGTGHDAYKMIEGQIKSEYARGNW
jgi:hypothetical protein